MSPAHCEAWLTKKRRRNSILRDDGMQYSQV